jgi:lipopolysaccharide transport system permease protein
VNRIETVITPHRGWLDIDLKSIWAYRDLVRLLVRRDLVAYYKQTILGPLWFALQPLATTLIFTIIFGKIAGLSTDGVPPFLFYMAGVVPWTYFSQCVTRTCDVFIANSAIFGKVYFPRLVVPIASVIANLATFAIQLLLFLAFYAHFWVKGSPVTPTAWLLALPVVVACMAVFGLAVGILISASTAKYRDLAFAVSFGMQLWMYATPVVYPLSQVPEAWRWVFALNPMTAAVEAFRHACLGTPQPSGELLLVGAAMTFVMLFAGLLLFTRVERWATDTA